MLPITWPNFLKARAEIEGHAFGVGVICGAFDALYWYDGIVPPEIVCFVWLVGVQSLNVSGQEIIVTDTSPAFDLDLGLWQKGPKYLKLLRALEAGVRAGQLPPGMKLPPVRTLAFKLGITPGTVARAYRMAVDEGLLEATTGRGTFVRRRTQ